MCAPSTTSAACHSGSRTTTSGRPSPRSSSAPSASSRPLRSAGVALPVRAVLLPAAHRPRQGRRRSARQGHPLAASGAHSPRGRPRRHAPRPARTPRRRARRHHGSLRSASNPCRCRHAPSTRAHAHAVGLAEVTGLRRGRRLLGAVRVGPARRHRARRRRRRRHRRPHGPGAPRTQTLRPELDRLPALPAGAGQQAAGGAPGGMPS